MNQHPTPKRNTRNLGLAIRRLGNRVSSIVQPCKNAILILAAIGFVCGSSLQAQWTQVWGGTFTGPANTTYNHANWWNNVQVNTGNEWGDGTIMSTSDSLQNVYLDGNGDLVIAMTYNPNPGTGQTQYTAARLTSTYAAGPYGKMDARIQNPSAVGMGAAFWAMGANGYGPTTQTNTANPSTAGGVPWPWCGELDMMELQSSNPTHNGSTIHGGETDGGTNYEYGGLSLPYNLPAGQSFDTAFHVFTTEWSPYAFQYFVDGNSYGGINLADLGATDQFEQTGPINFILSSGVGGNGGTPTGVGFPSNLVINYINYSQWSAGAPAPVTNLTTTANSNSVTLNWTASTTSGVTYDIYASTTAGTAPSVTTLLEQNATGNSFTATGLQPSTTYYFTVKSANMGGESTAVNATVATQAPGNSSGIQLSAGGYAVGTYMNSAFVLGGSTNYHYHNAVNTSLVTNPAPQQVYDTERWGAAAWTITGLNPLAGYNVRLHFVEAAYTAAGVRNFGVSINSAPVLTNFDIFAAAGAANTAVAEQYYTTADENGIIEIQTTMGTTTVTDLNPSISAIEIIPATGTNPVGATPGTISDLAIASGAPAATGKFVADEDFNGGDSNAPYPYTTAVTLNANSAPQGVYDYERYVPFTYVLTGLVADAPYTVNLHFAEMYWNAAGQRVFNVVINGNTVLSNLDVFKQTGGQFIAYDPHFTASADKYGQIILQFVYAGADQPFINGLEAVQAGNAVVPVGAASGLTATQSGSSVALNWGASTTSGVTYTLYRGAAGATPTSLVSNLTGTTYTDSTVAGNTAYAYYVVAVKGTSVSPNSNTATITTAGNTCSAVPPAAGKPSGTTTSSTASLTWTASTAPSNCSVTSYNVYRSTASGTQGTLVGTTASASFGDANLAASTTYYYEVSAVDGYGTSAVSAQGSVTTGSAPCTTGCGSSISINAGGAAVSNSGGGDNSFVADVDYSAGGTTYATTNTITIPASMASTAAPAAVYQTAREGATTYTVPGLTAGSSYTVRLHFAELYFSAAGNREFNVAINGTTVLTNFDMFAAAGATYTAVVENFTATANSSGQIVIAFTNGAVNQPEFEGIEVLGGTTVTAPAITTQPVAQTVVAGSTATYSVVASGTGLTYQWLMNGTAIAGATSASYTTPATTTAMSGEAFSCKVTNSGGSVTSSAASLTVTTVNPTGVSINAGGAAVSNSGGGDNSYVADEYFANGGTAVTTNTINVTGVANAAPAAVYQSERSGAATYTIPNLTAGTSYTVRLHFAEFYFTATGQRVFNVAINGTAVLSNFDIVALVGANHALVESFTATANTSGQIVIAFTNGTADQPKVSGIEVLGGTTVTAPAITTQPVAQTVAAGATATFSVVASGGGTLTYQWLMNGTAIAGATSASYTTPATTTAMSGEAFSCKVTNSAGSATSNTAALTVTTVNPLFVAINAAGAAVSNSGGGDNSFVADEDFVGGGASTTANAINVTGVTNAAPAAVYQTERAGVFTYTIPGMTAGSSHTVLLHFAETYWTAAAKRVFSVAINGTTVLSNFDIYALAGANKALVEQFTATANASGQIVISFVAGSADQPKVDGVEIR